MTLLCVANLSECVWKLDDSLQRVVLCENQNLCRVRHELHWLRSKHWKSQYYLCRIRQKLLVLIMSSDSTESDRFRHRLFHYRVFSGSCTISNLRPLNGFMAFYYQAVFLSYLICRFQICFNQPWLSLKQIDMSQPKKITFVHIKIFFFDSNYLHNEIDFEQKKFPRQTSK